MLLKRIQIKDVKGIPKCSNDDNVAANYIVPEREREVQPPTAFYTPLPTLSPLRSLSFHIT